MWCEFRDTCQSSTAQALLRETAAFGTVLNLLAEARSTGLWGVGEKMYSPPCLPRGMKGQSPELYCGGCWGLVLEPYLHSKPIIFPLESVKVC